MKTGELMRASDGELAVIVGAWARRKLECMRVFCEMFNKAMKDKWATRFYIDLFAGTGRCLVEGSNEGIDGSAMIALQCQPPFTHYYFNDIDKAKIDALKARVYKLPLPSAKVSFFQQDCNGVVSDILQELPLGGLGLCFVDPFGYAIKLASIQKLTEGRRIDLAATLHTGTLKRFGDQSPNEVDDFFGERGISTKMRDMLSSGSQRVTRFLLDTYKAKLISIGYKDTDDDTRVRTSRGPTLYHIVFASKHPLGLQFWRVASERASRQRRLPLVDS